MASEEQDTDAAEGKWTTQRLFAFFFVFLATCIAVIYLMSTTMDG